MMKIHVTKTIIPYKQPKGILYGILKLQSVQVEYEREDWSEEGKKRREGRKRRRQKKQGF